jgi:hypothetical protein
VPAMDRAGHLDRAMQARGSPDCGVVADQAPFCLAELASAWVLGPESASKGVVRVMQDAAVGRKRLA